MRALLAFLTLMIPLAVIAADDASAPQTNRAILVHSSVHLRLEPTTAAPSLLILKPGARVIPLGLERSGFLRVETADHVIGWVWAKSTTANENSTRLFAVNAIPLSARKQRAFAMGSGKTACASSLSDCPDAGCEEEGTPHALLNTIKRRMPTQAAPVTLSFKDFATLQYFTENQRLPVGQGTELTPEMRAQLKNIPLDGTNRRIVSEGDLVAMAGFIALDRNLRPSGGESVNCRLSSAHDNDIHIPLVAAPDQSEYKSIVVEPIPQDRPSIWSVSTFKELQSDGTQILVYGQLMFDNQHKVHDDPAE